MIISVSRRTDIPAFYSYWFFNRLKAGRVLVRNPFNANQISEISLAPRDVDCFVFWTRNPTPMLGRLGEIEAVCPRYYFLMTVTPYGKELEPGLPETQRRLEWFGELADRVGTDRAIWRYDPIILSNRTDFDFHLRAFDEMSRALEGKTKRVIISFMEWYRKVQRRLAPLSGQGWDFDTAPRELPDCDDFLRRLAQMAKSRGMEMVSCAQEKNDAALGITPGACIDPVMIHKLWDIPVDSSKDPGQRKHCHCAKSRDIGAADSCLHGCRYCYATISDKAARARYEKHDPDSDLLRVEKTY